MGPVLHDTADLGITITSDVTGEAGDFFLYEEKNDRDGDVTFWELHPTPQSTYKIPRLRGMVVKVWNT